jgi:hypothetical protein
MYHKKPAFDSQHSPEGFTAGLQLDISVAEAKRRLIREFGNHSVRTALL